MLSCSIWFGIMWTTKARSWSSRYSELDYGLDVRGISVGLLAGTVDYPLIESALKGSGVNPASYFVDIGCYFSLW